MRRAAKRDTSEPAIVKAFELAGASVWRLSDPNLPDLLVGWRMETHPVEVKTGKRKQSEGQLETAILWRGTPVEVVRTPEEATAMVKRWRSLYTLRTVGPKRQRTLVRSTAPMGMYPEFVHARCVAISLERIRGGEGIKAVEDDYGFPRGMLEAATIPLATEGKR
jgi:hypothetical protein